jgi:putative tryptophan/tyrosine transport system substrate-binding protein
MIRRREFITLLGGAATWPLAARAQQPALPVIGFLNAQTSGDYSHLVAAFHHGLNEGGFVEGRNVAIEYRWAERQTERLPALTADLIYRQVSVIVASGGATVAAIATTGTVPIPIVATFGGDPVKLGYAESLNRPGKNVTGVGVFSIDLEAKRLELLHDLVPSGLIAVLLDRRFLSDPEGQLKEVQTAARALGRQIQVIHASSASEIDAAFATVVQMRAVALAIGAGALFTARRNQLLALAARHKIPAMYENRESVLAGGLISYGPSVPDVYRQIGGYTARVLKGEKPADLPILLPTKFDMAINLRTAKALGITVPLPLLARADEVIE